MLAPSGVFQAIGFLSWGGRRRGRRSKDAAAKGWGCVATRLFVAPNHGKSAVRETPRSSRLNPSQRSSPLNDKRGVSEEGMRDELPSRSRREGEAISGATRVVRTGCASPGFFDFGCIRNAVEIKAE